MESTLALSRDDLRSDIGDFVGYGERELDSDGNETWTAKQARDIQRCLDAGLRYFYFPSSD